MSAASRPRVVMVTGAGAGLGRAIAASFAKRDAHIGLLSRDPVRLEAARGEVETLGGKGLVLPADVADAAQVEEAAAALESAFGPIDTWVNNAMASVFAPFKEVTPEEFRRVTEVTYLGYVHGTMSALRRMLPRDHGTIIQVGSALAYRSIPLQSAYCGAKHAIAGFTDSIRSELLHEGSDVKIAAVHMPALNTPQFSWVKHHLPRKPQPVPPIFQPEVGAEAVYWAAQHHPRELLVGWPTLEAVWAQKFIPGLLDRYLARVAYEGQQYDGPADPDRASNLWDPVPGSYGAHGDFDSRARNRSMQLWLRTHRAWAALASAGVLGTVYASLRRSR